MRALLLLFATAGTLSAQSMATPPPSSLSAGGVDWPFQVALRQQLAEQPEGTPTVALVMLGAVGSVAGGYAGGWLGRGLDRERDSGVVRGSGRRGIWLGALVGSVVGTTAAVHFANGGRSRVAEPLAGAIIGTAAGLAFAAATHDVDVVPRAVVVGQASTAAIFARIGTD